MSTLAAEQPKSAKGDMPYEEAAEDPESAGGAAAAAEDDDATSSVQVSIFGDGADAPAAAPPGSANGGMENSDPTPRKRRNSVELVVVATMRAKEFFKEVMGRLFVTVCILFLLGFVLGGLMNWAAWHLLNKADAMGWAQPWHETRRRVLDDSRWNSQTYVHVYDKAHRSWADVGIGFPKYSDHWIFIFYLRMAAAMVVGYGSPWFIMLAIHGIAKTWRHMLLCYTPFVALTLVFAMGNAISVVSSGDTFMSDLQQNLCIVFLSAVEAFVVLPYVGKRMGVNHMWKVVIFPFVLMNIGLFGLMFLMPLIICELSDVSKVLFRLFPYAILAELFVGSSRMANRLVPLAEESDYRPEDKVFAVLPLNCLFGYWGRIILMGMTDKFAIMAANFGMIFLEFASRTTVVKRDRLYLGVAWRSWGRRNSYWSENAKGMMRFRCSMIISHLFMEYLMIATAASFYWFSGIAKDLPSHLFNCAFQVGTELITDGFTLYWEIARHKLPVIAAWFDRQKHWGPVFGLFVIGFNIFAISQAFQYFCGMRNPDDPDWIMLLYCGAEK